MINEERVKELYQMALYDKEHDSMEQKAGRYFKSDYISGQLVKSFITGTVAFAMLLVLWGMSRLDKLFDLIPIMDLLYPELFESEKCRVDIEVEGKPIGHLYKSGTMILDCMPTLDEEGKIYFPCDRENCDHYRELEEGLNYLPIIYVIFRKKKTAEGEE